MKQDEIVVLGIDGIKGEEKEPGLIVKLLATGENVSLSLLQAQPGRISKFINTRKKSCAIFTRAKD